MRKKDIEVGAVYTAKVSGKVCRVRITGESQLGNGWHALNLDTGRPIRIRGVQRLREKVQA